MNMDAISPECFHVQCDSCKFEDCACECHAPAECECCGEDYSLCMECEGCTECGTCYCDGDDSDEWVGDSE
jgi:hypothetical protein